MKLTEDQLEKGRNHLRSNDLDGFNQWIDNNEIFIDKTEMRNVFGTLIRVDIDRAIKLFDLVFANMDPQANYRVHVFWLVTYLGLGALFLLGCHRNRLVDRILHYRASCRFTDV